MSTTHVYKLLTADQWQAADRTGRTDVPVDREDGYVHLSTKSQVGETARRYFSDTANVRLVRFPVEALPPLKWEPSRGGQMFPHLYGPLEMARADRVWMLDLSPSGTPVIPVDC